MINYSNDLEIGKILENNSKIIMVFVKGLTCSVCHAVENRINTTFPNTYSDLDIHYITLEESPLFRGQHLVFSVPTLILFDKQKEIHRESAIIDFTRLNKVLNLVLE